MSPIRDSCFKVRGNGVAADRLQRDGGSTGTRVCAEALGSGSSITSGFWRLKQNRCSQSNRTKVIAKRMNTSSFRARLLANAIPSTDFVANARVALPQSGRVAGISMSYQYRNNFMAKRPTSITTGDISKYTKASNLSERVMQTIHKLAIASAVAFSAFVFTATPGSAARVGRSIAHPQQYCMYYDEGGTDCSFTSYAQCEATASGESGGCYANSPPDDEPSRR
jgi:hypothetical protein